MNESLKNLLFCADLVEFTLKQRGIDYELITGARVRHHVGKSPFQDNIGRAVQLFIGTSKINFDLTPKMHDVIKNTLSHYHLYFEKGYNPKNYIKYCAYVLHIMIKWIEKFKKYEICEALVGPLASILDSYTLTREFKDLKGWNGIQEDAEDMLKNIQKDKGAVTSSQKA